MNMLRLVLLSALFIGVMPVSAMQQNGSQSNVKFGVNIDDLKKNLITVGGKKYFGFSKEFKYAEYATEFCSRLSKATEEAVFWDMYKKEIELLSKDKAKKNLKNILETTFFDVKDKEEKNTVVKQEKPFVFQPDFVGFQDFESHFSQPSELPSSKEEVVEQSGATGSNDNGSHQSNGQQFDSGNSNPASKEEVVVEQPGATGSKDNNSQQNNGHPVDSGNSNPASNGNGGAAVITPNSGSGSVITTNIAPQFYKRPAIMVPLTIVSAAILASMVTAAYKCVSYIKSSSAKSRLDRIKEGLKRDAAAIKALFLKKKSA